MGSLMSNVWSNIAKANADPSSFIELFNFKFGQTETKVLKLHEDKLSKYIHVDKNYYKLSFLWTLWKAFVNQEKIVYLYNEKQLAINALHQFSKYIIDNSPSSLFSINKLIYDHNGFKFDNNSIIEYSTYLSDILSKNEHSIVVLNGIKQSLFQNTVDIIKKYDYINKAIIIN